MHLSTLNMRPGENPQTEAADPTQVQNNAGGFVFEVDEWTRLERFAILGSGGGSYYTSEQKLTRENAQHVFDMIEKHGSKVVDRIVEISDAGRAPKQSYGIWILAACASAVNRETRQAAYAAIPKVCRTASTLFEFVSYIKSNKMRGWSRGLRTAVSRWYTDKSADQIAYQVVKYQNRNGFTHRDLLRLAHPYASSDPHNRVFKWVTGKEIESWAEFPEAIQNVERLKTNLSHDERIVLASRLPREALPTEWLTDPKVWEALLMGGQGMPLTAMIRNLATMTRVGLLLPGSAAAKYITGRLGDETHLKAARVHPAAILTALATYRSGKGQKSSATWIPTPEIVDALDAAFYLSFVNVVPAGKRTMIALDVSGSMEWPTSEISPGFTAREACSAMAMIQVATEPSVITLAFANQLTKLPLAKGQRLSDVAAYVSRLPATATDCSLPIVGAMQNNDPIDTFVIYTDNEANFGSIHPFQALRKYREATGIPAKLVVVGTTATNFTIADPRDAGMLDCIGWDSAMPGFIADFSRVEMST